ncbi:MAG: DNA alkylation repair protein [Candidatus Diapherotrites archaeon]|nr:DNA alkylation repair protein [Candidatus Diapherotrites archaeon]
MITADEVKKELQKLSNAKQAKILQRFFKTGKGEYGEGGIFLGIKVPRQREVAKKFPNLRLKEIHKLLDSGVHEHRMVGLFILVGNYEKAKKEADEFGKKKIFDFYLKHTKKINNWDLVDLSAPNIPGNYLLGKDRKILYKLAKSKNLWERRIAILATYTFIRNNEFSDALKISEILLKDKHDLIHKAAGWMLREVGKRDLAAEEKFLKKYYKKMPRTMLRYAIEKFPDGKREFYLG